MKKIPKKYSGIVLGILLPIIMIFFVSFVVTVINIGFVDDFFVKWICAYFGTLIFALPIGFIVIPTVKSFVDRMTE